MINSITYDSRNIPLTKNIKKSSNIYSVIIGKNGTGKSRLLQLICDEILNEKTEKIKFTDRPSRIIAISTTPFDKFSPQTNIKKGYFYQGIKGIDTINLSKGYLSKFIVDFLLGVINNKINSLSKALDYLGYEDEITIDFKYLGGDKIKEIIYEKTDDYSLDDAIYNLNIDKENNKKFTLPMSSKITSLDYTLFTKNSYFKDTRTFQSIREYLSDRIKLGDKQINQSYIINDKKLISLVNSLKESEWIHNTRTLQLVIKDNEILFNKKFVLSNNFIKLIDSGLFKIDKIILRKKHSKERFEIGNASSGEQSVIINILGISSIIKDNSLILIDEPEVCLHPEWQEKYITLLINIFKNQKKCHFIIATHSPQIIANLNEKNCFITSIEDNSCNDAKDYIKKSSDYQLATLFNTPGFKNEYLSRISLNLLSKIMANKSIDNEDRDTMNKLLAIKNKLSSEDPILSLIISLEEMVGYYG
ncbi:ATP-binding protein [Providencia rettgeri]|uniref:AAA family ATPase n=1 Tax=Providencia rettgeri TaxID=587 RepID=UPI001E3A43D4|nr:AAA family ATPase [Providencia rettgeri]UEK60841.1 ATP-binding protein [Providencia rettgeri]